MPRNRRKFGLILITDGKVTNRTLCSAESEIDTQSSRDVECQGAVVGVGRSIRLDEDSSSGLASLRTSELLLRIAGVRRNEAPRRNESRYSLRGHRRTAHA